MLSLRNASGSLLVCFCLCPFIWSERAQAQGCVAAKVDTPLLSFIPGAPKEGRKEISLNWRWQVSDRHFVGSKEQKERQKEGSEVINRLNILDLGFAFELNEKWTLSVGIPLQMAERSSPIRNEDDHVIARTTTHARGLGDVTGMARRWILQGTDENPATLRLGLGVKLPTGMNNVMDTRQRYENGQIVNKVETVDQSIQPGDGGFGLLLDMQAGWKFSSIPTGLYFSALYLLNPQGGSGVQTYRSRAAEAEMSIADQYVARAGISYMMNRPEPLTLSLGARLEGVPAEDLIGPSEDFRRPGYAVSLEPGVSYAVDNATWSLAVPVAVHRNRVKSVTDKREGRHGDAAFADYIVLAGYSMRY